MRKKYLFFAFSICVVAALFLSYACGEMTRAQFVYEVENVLNEHQAKLHIKGYSLSYKNNDIALHIKVRDGFSQIPPEKQFMIFSSIHRKLRYNLKQDYPYNYFYQKNISITAYDDGVDYHFEDTYPNKKLVYMTNGILSINKKRLTRQEFLRSPYFADYLEQLKKRKTSSGYPEQEVYEYLLSFHKTLTINKKERKDMDSDLVIEVLKDRFDISGKEIADIFNRWTFYLD